MLQRQRSPRSTLAVGNRFHSVPQGPSTRARPILLYFSELYRAFTAATKSTNHRQHGDELSAVREIRCVFERRSGA